MAKGHKKIVGSYCYKGNGCTSRFCEFCCNGDKYEEIEDESYLENQYSTNEAIKERIDGLIETYQMYIDANRQTIRKHKEVLIEKLNKGSCDYVKHNAEKIEQNEREIALFEMFIESLKYAKTGERKWINTKMH